MLNVKLIFDSFDGANVKAEWSNHLKVRQIGFYKVLN